MNTRFKRTYKKAVRMYIAILAGVAVNVGLSAIMFFTGVPLYLDSIGTITVAALGGIFPGILTAMLSNILCSFFNENALYYAIISVIIAMITASFARYDRFDKRRNYPIFISVIAIISGVLGISFQWLLIGGPQFKDVADAAELISADSGMGYFLSALLVNTGLNLVDKALASIAAFFAYHAVPRKIRIEIRNSGWKQRPLSKEEVKNIYRESNVHSLQRKVSAMLSAAAILLAFIMIWISLSIYSDNLKKDYTENAINAAEFAASIIDGDKIGDYLKYGKNDDEYLKIEDMLYKIRDNAQGVKYLYITKVDKKGCTFVFDLDTEDDPGYEPGELVAFEEAFEPYLPALFEGEEIDPVVSDETFGWLLTIYRPIRNSYGRTVAYAGADVSMSYISGYAAGFVAKTLIIFSGFFVLVVGCGLTISGYNLVYPIESMTKSAKDFIMSHGEQKDIDASVKSIRSLNICTDGEVQELYNALCKMESDMSEQLRDIRHYADATSKMQNGLIVTMADMVENRDSDTGAHVQKTSAYVRIILEGLKKKGYYAEKLTPKYMASVEMSAPLHDVGKINIPDNILNQPRKLTDEEFEIMKTHTISGKNIMEKAISSVQGGSYLKEARNMAAYHHERWDGKGYPEGLHGEVIPLSARIMAVADVFDALTSARVYKPPLPLDQALEMISDGSGTQFDPKCVQVFLDSLSDIKRVLRKYNNQDV